MRIYSLRPLFPGLFIALLGLAACKSDNSRTATSESETLKQPPAAQVNVPEFNADSAYAYIAAQVAFGPRVVATKGHDECGKWIENKLRAITGNVEVQRGNVTLYNGKVKPIANYIAYINKEAPKRIILSAHWDTRPFNDRQPINPDHIPIDGANDGGSGVAVVLEIARQLMTKKPDIGIMILFVDAEDYGPPAFDEDKPGYNTKDAYCLGMQYWANNLDKTKYTAHFGINFDMVGGPNATFLQEGVSKMKAPNQVARIWQVAGEAGYRQYFVQAGAGEIVDDHLYMATLAGIPCVNIIDLNYNREHAFPETWHTLEDNLSNISKASLKAAGQTILHVIYTEHPTL